MRTNYSKNGTFGTYRVQLGDDVIRGYTIEPASGQGKGPIPLGTYDANLYWWSKKGYEVLWLQKVPNFTEVFLHRGAVATNSTGCTLVGKNFGGNSLFNSKQAMDELIHRIVNYQADQILEGIRNGSLEFSRLDKILEINAQYSEAIVTVTWEIKKII